MVLDPEDEGTAVFQDVANHSPSDTELHPRWLWFTLYTPHCPDALQCL